MNFKDRISKQLVVMLLFVFIGGVVMAQTMVRGTVTSSEDGGPIPGVSVVVQGTTVGTTTDANGQYSITVEDLNVTLIFRFIGYLEQLVPVNGRSVVDIIMQPSLEEVGEVVVTALGIRTEKRALGYATSEVGADEIDKAKSTDFVQALSGKVAGVQINTVSSQQGSGSRIVIRGGSSITGNNQPLFVVNGVPFDAANDNESTGIADIDPATIENVSILKGAAASALYGSRAANGVVLITTKKGAFNTAPVVKFSHTSLFDKIWEIPLQKEWAQGYYDDGYTYATVGSSSWGTRIDETPEAEYYDRWQVFKTGYTAVNSFTVTGGSNVASYFVAVSNNSNSGVIETMGYDRTSITGNTSYRFTDKLTVSTNFTYSKQKGERLFEDVTNSAFMNTLMASPNTWNPYPIYDEEGNLRLYRGGGRNPYLFTLDNSLTTIERNRTLANLTVEWEIFPFLKFRSVSGASSSQYRYEDYFNKGGLQRQNGEYFLRNTFNRELESTNILTYEQTFGDFGISAFAGHNIVDEYWEGMDIDGEALVLPDVFNVANLAGYSADGWKGRLRSWSLFGEARFSYKSMIYYTVTGRNDWSSSLDNDFFYPSHSLGFIFTELLADNSILTFGKLRAGYAKVGRATAAYRTNVNLDQASGNGIIWPFMGMSSYLPSNEFPNPDLVNEFKSEIEFGLDLRFFQGRLDLDVAYYSNWSTNQIVWQSLLSSTGYSGGYINIGEIEHKGVELLISGTPVQTANFSWDIVANWAKDNSLVVKLGEYDEPIGVGGGATAVVGEPYPVQYGTAWLRDDQGRLVLDDRPGLGYGRPLSDDRGSQVLGKAAPDWVGGIRNIFTYKGLSLIAQIDFQKGGLIYSQNDHYLTWYGMAEHQEDRPDDDMITFDGVLGHLDGNDIVITSETPVPTRYSLYYQRVCQWVREDNLMPKDYIKLRELILSYDLPASLIQNTFIKGLSVSFTGRNLWRKFNKDYYDPDPEIITGNISNGNSYTTYSFPSLKTYSFTVNVTF